jgi:hypothetical protein
MKRRRRLIVTVIGTTAAMMALATAGVGVATTLAGDSGSPFVKLAKKTYPMTPAAKRQIALLRHADLSTRAGAVRYLKARGVDPRHVVIQLGRKNYAGPKCPGKSWSCTKSRRVVQAGAVNVAYCQTNPSRTGDSIVTGPGSCSITQSGGGTATCAQTMTTSPANETCSIDQTSTSADNRAVVIQAILQGSGGPSGSQTGTQGAFITQANGSGNNYSNASQTVGQSLGKGSNLSDDDDNDADDFTAAIAASITQSQEAHQSLSVIQTSTAGNNTSNAGQIQGQRERADRAPSISQRQNTVDAANACPTISSADDPFANACYAVQQTAPVGANSTKLGQVYVQFQAASNTPGGDQAQGSLTNAASGGLDHAFVQNPVTGMAATQTSNQFERMIQRRLNTGAMIAKQHGPVRKGTGTQDGGAGSTADQVQDSGQFSFGGVAGTQTDLLVDQCASSGNCTVRQQVNQNGTVTTNTKSGPFLFEFVNCGGVSITPPGNNFRAARSFSAVLAAACGTTPTTSSTTTTIPPPPPLR